MTQTIINELSNYSEINREDLFHLISKNYGDCKKSTIYSIISKLIEEDVLYKVTSKYYRVGTKRRFGYLLSPYASKIKNELNKYGVPFIIYETSILNDWLNHLLASNCIIIEVDKMHSEFIFDYLKSRKFKNILLNPSVEELYKYKTDDSIIIMNSSKYSPKKDEYIMLEKIIVDLYSNKILKSFFEEAELKYIYETIFKVYQVDFQKVFSYAKRKKIYESFIEYLETNGIKGDF